MADKKLSTLTSSSGALKPAGFNSGQIASGASGNILSVTAGDGQYLRLSALFANLSTVESNITLTIDGVNIISGGNLDDTNPNATASSLNFSICDNYGSTNTAGSVRVLRDMYCKSFTVTKDSGTTSQDINYAYYTLEIL